MDEKKSPLAGDRGTKKDEEMKGGISQGQDTPRIGVASRFPLINIADIAMEPPQYVIDQIFERDSTCVAFGESESGKTLWAIDAGCSVSAGIDFHGYKVATSCTIYVCGEGRSAIRRRVKAWEIEHDIDLSKTETPFLISELSVDLLQKEIVQNVCGAIDELAEQVGAPGIIVFDTLSQTQSGNDNDNAEMAQYFQAAQRIRSKYGSVVLVNHHVGHGEKDRTRGAYAIRANPDAQIIFKKENDVVTVENIRQRDGPKFAPMSFRIVQHELGLTMPGTDRPVTSVALRRALDVKPKDKPVALRDNQQKWLSAIQKLVADKQYFRDSSGDDSITLSITRDSWISEAKNIGANVDHPSRDIDSLIEKKLVVKNLFDEYELA
jgi:hypothetical protein